MVSTDKVDTKQFADESHKDSVDLPIPQAILQPPDYFTGSKPELTNSNISNVIAIGKWKIIAGETVSVVDQSGQIQPLPEKFKINQVIDVRTILDEAIKQKKEYISIDGTHSSSTNVLLAEFIRKLDPTLSDNELRAQLAQTIEILQLRKVEVNKNTYCRASDVNSVVTTIPHDHHDPAQLLNQDEKTFQVESFKGIFKVVTSENIDSWNVEKLSSKSATAANEVITTQGLKVKKYAEDKARLFDERNQQLLVLPDTDPSLDPDDNSTIWLVDDGKVMSLDGEKITTGSYEFSEAKLPPEIGKCLAVDITHTAIS